MGLSNRDDIDGDCVHGGIAAECPKCTEIARLARDQQADADGYRTDWLVLTNPDAAERHLGARVVSDWLAAPTGLQDSRQTLSTIFSGEEAILYAEQQMALSAREGRVLRAFLSVNNGAPFSHTAQTAGCSRRTAQRDLVKIARRFLVSDWGERSGSPPGTVEVTRRRGERTLRVSIAHEVRIGKWVRRYTQGVHDVAEKRRLLRGRTVVPSILIPVGSSQMSSLLGALWAEIKPLQPLRHENRQQFVRRQLIHRGLENGWKLWAPTLPQLQAVMRKAAQAAPAEWKREFNEEFDTILAERRAHRLAHPYMRLRRQRADWTHNLRWAQRRLKGKDAAHMSRDDVLTKLRGRLPLCRCCYSVILVGCRLDGKRITRRRAYCDDVCKMRAQRRGNDRGSAKDHNLPYGSAA